MVIGFGEFWRRRRRLREIDGELGDAWEREMVVVVRVAVRSMVGFGGGGGGGDGVGDISSEWSVVVEDSWNRLFKLFVVGLRVIFKAAIAVTISHQ